MNRRALWALALSVVACLTITFAARTLANYNWFIGAGLGLVFYYVLMKPQPAAAANSNMM